MLAALVAAAVIGVAMPDPRLSQWQFENVMGVNARKARNYQTMRQVWGAVRPSFPGRAMPMPYFNHPRIEAGIWADTNGQARGFGWNDEMQNNLLGKGERKNRGVNALVHEWAHNFQRPDIFPGGRFSPTDRTGGDTPLIEGGATAYADLAAALVGKKLGFKYTQPPISHFYKEWAAKVLAERGPDWVTRDQFFTT